MKVAGLDLHDLRRALRQHPALAEHVDDPTAVDRMRSSGLTALAKKLGADPAAMIEEFRRQDQERMLYSTRFPAFRGTLNFELTVEVLGKRVTRKARADYTFTPEWEYHDPKKRKVFKGWPGSSLCMTVLTQPEDGWDGAGWEKIDILNIMEIWNILDDAIEERCKAEDAKRRRAAERKRRGKPRAGNNGR